MRTTSWTLAAGLCFALVGCDRSDGFYLHPNGVTVLCHDAEVGATGRAGGVTYTRRSGSELRALRDDFPEALATSCTSGITDMSHLFDEATAFNQDISSWDTSSVTDMFYMFNYTTAFNQDISSWDTSSVTNMDYMFEYTTAFNQDLSGWCVENIDSEPEGFHSNRTWTLPQPVWGSCPSR